MDAQPTLSPVFSVVIPMYNEAEIIGEMHRRLAARWRRWLPRGKSIYVNDGSRDATLRMVETLRRRDRHIAIVNLSRNFGKEIATTAGLDHAQGEAVIVIDADLQDPPEVIPQSRRCLARRLRHGLCPAPPARRRWLAEKGHRRGVLSPHAQPGRSAAATECRRLPADEPPGGRCGAAVARAPSLHEGPVRLGRLSQHRHRLRSRAARRRHAPNGRSGNCGIWRSRASPASASPR